MSPKKMEIGRAGRALRTMPRMRLVTQRPFCCAGSSLYSAPAILEELSKNELLGEWCHVVIFTAVLDEVYDVITTCASSCCVPYRPTIRLTIWKYSQIQKKYIRKLSNKNTDLFSVVDQNRLSMNTGILGSYNELFSASVNPIMLLKFQIFHAP